jgi:nicotinate dehydrogenase subunit A
MESTKRMSNGSAPTPNKGLSIVVNGTRHAIASSGDTPLLYVLRDELGLTGPKFGCGLAQCGACSVIINGLSTRSCVFPVSAVTSPVTTLEGLGTPQHPHPLQRAFIEEQALQCGYCTSGLIISSAALLLAHPHPTDAQIVAALGGNLCRCGVHQRVVTAVKKAAGATA